MKRLVLMNLRRVGLALLFLAPALTAAQSDMQWLLRGSDPSSYDITGRGSVQDDSGATLTIQSKTRTAPGFGTVMSAMPAGNFAGKRVRISADIETRDVSVWAAVWLRADSSGRQQEFKNSREQSKQGTRPRPPLAEAIIDVPSSATHLVFGLMLEGAGVATARNVKVTAVGLTPPDRRR